jgi:hypothetical protein
VRVIWAAPVKARPKSVQQLQFLQVQGLQRQPPFVQLQVQPGALVSIFFSMVWSPIVAMR